MKPEDIDFAVSSTFRDGLSEMHGWPVQPRCESLQEARAREDSERIRKGRLAGEEVDDREYIKKLYRRIAHTEAEVERLAKENALLDNRVMAPTQEKKRNQWK